MQLDLASRLLTRVVSPTGRPTERRLRETVGGKVILVTGASHGIGEATARKLTAAGATVLLVARSRERLEELQAQYAVLGGSVYVYATDLSHPESVDALAARVLEEHEHVDVIISNAGKSIRRSIERSYDRFHDFQRTIGVNYLGPVKLLLAFLPSMRARRRGHIVNVSTAGVRVPPAPYWAAYQASKAAFDVFLRTAAMEIAADRVKVSSIYMALVHTRMSAPTPSFRSMPGLTPDQAADLVCKAIVERPASITPWWARAVEMGTAVSRRPWELAGSLYSQLTGDTASAAAADEERVPQGA